MTRVVIIVGEASGDLLASGLIKSLKNQNPEIQIEGITGPRMRDAGCSSWGDYQQLAVMGIVEVFWHLPRLWALMKHLISRLEENPPDLLIGVDAPDFNLRLLKRARSSGIKTLQYVCPSVWAWRQNRIKTIAKACDHVLCLLPFELDLLRKSNISSDFVGHPLADEIATKENFIPVKSNPVIAVLPGSRLSEINHLGPVFADAINWLKERRPDLCFVTGAANQQTEMAFNKQCKLKGISEEIFIKNSNARLAIEKSDVVLAASGTVTLEAMLIGRPMVVAYKVSFITSCIIRLLGGLKVKYCSLPNLLAGRNLVPEFIQDRAVGSKLGTAILSQLDSPEYQIKLKSEFKTLSKQLRQSANESAARVIHSILI
ncbi:MAG: lipid-A-disaccharide synthase [Pseudomonadota bacterium]|nr:lipid-A-disaccharide synthase [Pseudomonadota bacterium]